MAKTGNDEIVDVLANVATEFNLKPEIDDTLIFVAAREGNGYLEKKIKILKFTIQKMKIKFRFLFQVMIML